MDALSMRVLNIEDEIFKHCAIARVLRDLGIEDVTQVNNLEEALELIEQNEYDLYITDMHYPERRGSGDAKSGEKFIELMNEKGNTVPIIMCSSARFGFSSILANVHYAENSDWENELYRVVKKLLT